MNGADPAAANGANVDLAAESSKILQALEIIHSPSTKNEVRKQASDYLESLKSNDAAASYGAFLGSDPSNPPLVRHYGLSLIEHTIRHKLHHQTESQNTQVRGWVIDLGKSLAETDPPFVRNKVAELWIELAKRTWALEWFDLDQYLVDFWSGGARHKDLVLTILENLSDDVFVRDDSTAILRGPDLNGGLVEIFTSPDDFIGGLKVNNEVIRLRAGEEGWLARISSLLEVASSGENASKHTVLKCLATLRSAMGWLMTPAIAHTNTLPKICSCLSGQDPDILIAALDCLVTLYSRSRLEDSDVKTLVIPLCCTENIFALRDLYRKSVIGVDGIESPRYTISKKLSEMISYLAGLLVHTSHDYIVDQDTSVFLEFMVEICQHESLIVSIPTTHAWVKILGSGKWRKSSSVAACVGPLLQFACQRTIQYDLLGDDSDEPAVIFVNDEIELSTERAGFFLNYRRLCYQIIELICYTHMTQAIPYLVSQVDAELDALQKIDSVFSPANFVQSQISLRLDAQFSNVESAFRGFFTWKTDHAERRSEEQENMLATIGSQIQAWSNNLLVQREFKEPFAKQRMIKCVVDISNRALRQDDNFALKVLEHILKAFIPDLPEHEAYSDAVQELHMYASRELRHLAVQHADYFITFYDQFETKLRDLSTTSYLSAQVQADLSASLFLIVQRANNIDDATRKARLWSFMEPLSLAWQDAGLQEIVSTFETFCQSQCFNQVGPFLLSIEASNLETWSEVPLDPLGLQLQAEMGSRASKMPLRLTRTLLANSTDKLSHSSPVYAMTCELWSMILPHMVQGLLQIASYTHRLHDPASWPNVPTDKRLISRVLRDRFWQSGITEGSKNDFYAMIKSSKKSLEGFASSVRNKLRLNIEQTYTILHSLSKLGETFYGVPNLAEAISQALIETARPLSAHHYTIFLSMVSRVVDDCPASQRHTFLDQMLPSLLSEMDQKCTGEWQKLEGRSGLVVEQSDDLTLEMREESLLRQLTHKAASTVALWIDVSRNQQQEQQKRYPTSNGTAAIEAEMRPQLMSSYIMSNSRVLPPLLLFYTHAISFKDTKSVTTVVLTLRSLVMELLSRSFTDERLDEETAAAVREFLSTETLKAAITSLNDGYFAEQQRDLAALIATIWSSFSLPMHVPATETQPAYERPPFTTAARDVLLSLPGLTEERVDAAGMQLMPVRGHHRHERAVILGLLEGFRGVRLSELGKIDVRAQKNKLMEKYIMRDSMGMQTNEGGSKEDKGGEVDLGGVADMFG
jgi:exportin-5